MANLPSPTQVAGKHSAIYESLYNFVDPNGLGAVGAMEAARFLKRSGLSDVVLSRIWDLSDPSKRGCLDKAGMFTALKLVAVAQNGRGISLSNVTLDLPPPKMGDIPLLKPVKPPPPANTPLISSFAPSGGVDWTIKPSEREKYDKLFESLQPLNGLIPGNKVKGVLMDSKLPLDTLGKIWDLADQDEDGMLDRHEFVVAMHLVYKALEKHTVPNTLPPELMPPPKRKDSIPASIATRGIDGVKNDRIIPTSTSPCLPPVLVEHIAPTPIPAVQQPAPAPPAAAWVVTPDEKSKFDALFVKSDIDRDGFVSGQEIKDVFLQSGVPQLVLAHIWALCDIKQSGKLNNEQFALAMWFVARCLNGIEPPRALTPDMVPPSFRSGKPTKVLENNNSPYSNPELDMISKDIEELSREKLALEADIQQKEADIKIKSGECKSLQSELDTLAATLKQLENQKGEAQKRLNDLRMQRSAQDKEHEEVDGQMSEHEEKVDKLRTQAAEQAESLATQEADLASKKEQLEGLKQEEQRLEQQRNDNLRQLEGLATNLQDTQLQISQIKALITQLQEQTRQMSDAIVACDSAIESGDSSGVSDTALRIGPEFRDPQYARLGLTNGDVAANRQQNGFGDSEDPFADRTSSRSNSAAFQDDPFKSDPFKDNPDAFNSNDPFSAAFPSQTNNGFSSDPFNSFNPASNTKADPFDAFGDSKKPTDNDAEDEKDPFGCDPFAVLHAPTRDSPMAGRSASPSPALPPKKNKQPPPRPAPPRPAPPGPKSPAQDAFGAPRNDPFAAEAAEVGGGAFANFADFDDKFDKPASTIPTTNKPKTAPSRGLDFTDDPFRDYRYEDPFNIVFDDSDHDADTKTGRSAETKKKDPFGLDSVFSALSDGRQSVPLFSSVADPASGRTSAPPTWKEDQQLAWIAKESLKLEEARRQRLIQEEADLELAISLSKAEKPKP